MRDFNYTKIRDNKWDSELLGLIAAIYPQVHGGGAGQEFCLTYQDYGIAIAITGHFVIYCF